MVGVEVADDNGCVLSVVVHYPPFGEDRHGRPQVVPGAIGVGARDGGMQRRCCIIKPASGGQLSEGVAGIVNGARQLVLLGEGEGFSATLDGSNWVAAERVVPAQSRRAPRCATPGCGSTRRVFCPSRSPRRASGIGRHCTERVRGGATASPKHVAGRHRRIAASQTRLRVPVRSGLIGSVRHRARPGSCRSGVGRAGRGRDPGPSESLASLEVAEEPAEDRGHAEAGHVGRR